MLKLRNILYFLTLLGVSALFAAPTVTLLVSKMEHLPLRQAATGQLIGRFMVSNPERTPFAVLITFEQACNIRHFTTGKGLPLQSIALKWNDGTQSGTTTLYDRSLVGQNCQGILQWTPPDPAPANYASAYQLDLYTDWNAPGQSVALAGLYQETIHVVAIEATVP